MRLVGISMALAIAMLYGGCAKESSRALEVLKTQATKSVYKGERAPLSIGAFDNRSSYMRGIFSDGVDKLGSQAKTILISHLQQTNRFTILDRDNLSQLKQEAGFAGKTNSIMSAKYVITGDVAEFGRKEVGDHQLFGILGKGKSQIAYAKVILNVVDVGSSAVVHTSQGSGEYELSNREVIGFGGTSSYDSTLNGKVLDLAIREAVDSLVNAISDGSWNPHK